MSNFVSSHGDSRHVDITLVNQSSQDQAFDHLFAKPKEEPCPHLLHSEALMKADSSHLGMGSLLIALHPVGERKERTSL